MKETLSCIDGVEGYLIDGDDRLLVKNVNNLPMNACVLEIGSYLGLSAHIMKKTRPDLKLYCIDTWAGSKEHEWKTKTDDIFLKFLENMERNKHKLITIRGESKTILLGLICTQLVENKIYNSFADFIFIDGAHDYESVRWDVGLSMLLIKPYRKMLLHDCDGDVLKAMLDSVRNRYEWKYKIYPHPESNYMCELWTE